MNEDRLRRLDSLSREIETRQRELDSRRAEYEQMDPPTAERLLRHLAQDEDRLAGARDAVADERDAVAADRDAAAGDREGTAIDRAVDRAVARAAEREEPEPLDAEEAERYQANLDRDAALDDRSAARSDRRHAATERAQRSAERADEREWRERQTTQQAADGVTLRGLAEQQVTALDEAALTHDLAGALLEQLALDETHRHRLAHLLDEAEQERARAEDARRRAADARTEENDRDDASA